VDFNLIRKEHEAKVPYAVRLYTSTVADLEKIATEESITVGAFVRHAINNAIKDYEQSKQNNTEVTDHE